jgi:hypothetical protein
MHKYNLVCQTGGFPGNKVNEEVYHANNSKLFVYKISFQKFLCRSS